MVNIKTKKVRNVYELKNESKEIEWYDGNLLADYYGLTASGNVKIGKNQMGKGEFNK